MNRLSLLFAAAAGLMVLLSGCGQKTETGAAANAATAGLQAGAKAPDWTLKDLDDALFYGILGTLIGGRLGYVIFYKFAEYAAAPWKILYVWEGGMSFHGGFLGVLAAAAAQGYAPDVTVCAGETPSGRPGPSMALKCVIELDVSPVAACVKIGDTVVDIEEGLNAGMWTIALAETGNEVGLPEAQWLALPAAEQAKLGAVAAETLARAGAHYVVPRLGAVLPVLDQIEERLRRGERP